MKWEPWEGFWSGVSAAFVANALIWGPLFATGIVRWDWPWWMR